MAKRSHSKGRNREASPDDVDLSQSRADEVLDMFHKDLSVNSDNLSEEFAEQPTKFAYWASCAEKACAAARQMKFRLEVLCAEVDAEVRDAAVRNDEKMTEPRVKAAVLLDARVQALTAELHQAYLEEGVLFVARDAFNHRRDMLVQLGAHSRAEMDAEIAILKKSARRRLDEARRGG